MKDEDEVVQISFSVPWSLKVTIPMGEAAQLFSRLNGFEMTAAFDAATAPMEEVGGSYRPAAESANRRPHGIPVEPSLASNLSMDKSAPIRRMPVSSKERPKEKVREEAPCNRNSSSNRFRKRSRRFDRGTTSSIWGTAF
jgi:hypothetical protein